MLVISLKNDKIILLTDYKLKLVRIIHQDGGNIYTYISLYRKSESVVMKY